MKNRVLSAVLSVIICVVQLVAMFSAASIFVADDYISAENVNKQTELLDLSAVLGGAQTEPLVTEFSSPAKSSAEVMLEQAISFDVIQDYWTLPLGSGTPSWRVVINVVGDNARAATEHAKAKLAEQLKTGGVYLSLNDIAESFASAYAEYVYEHGYIKSSDRVSCKAEIDKHLGYYFSTLEETELFTPVSFDGKTIYFSVTGERGPAFQNYVADMLNGARSLAVRSYLCGAVDYIKLGEETPLVDTAAVKEYLVGRMNEASQIYGFSLSEADKELLSGYYDEFINKSIVNTVTETFPERSAIDGYIGADLLAFVRTTLKPAVRWSLVALCVVLALLCVLVWKKKRTAVFFESITFILTAAALGVAGIFARSVDLTSLQSTASLLAGADAAETVKSFVGGFAREFVNAGLLLAAAGVLLLLAALAFGRKKNELSAEAIPTDEASVDKADIAENEATVKPEEDVTDKEAKTE